MASMSRTTDGLPAAVGAVWFRFWARAQRRWRGCGTRCSGTPRRAPGSEALAPADDHDMPGPPPPSPLPPSPPPPSPLPPSPLPPSPPSPPLPPPTSPPRPPPPKTATAQPACAASVATSSATDEAAAEDQMDHPPSSASRPRPSTHRRPPMPKTWRTRRDARVKSRRRWGPCQAVHSRHSNNFATAAGRRVLFPPRRSGRATVGRRVRARCARALRRGPCAAAPSPSSLGTLGLQHAAASPHRAAPRHGCAGRPGLLRACGSLYAQRE